MQCSVNASVFYKHLVNRCIILCHCCYTHLAGRVLEPQVSYTALHHRAWSSLHSSAVRSDAQRDMSPATVSWARDLAQKAVSSKNIAVSVCETLPGSDWLIIDGVRMSPGANSSMSGKERWDCVSSKRCPNDCFTAFTYKYVEAKWLNYSTN